MHDENYPEEYIDGRVTFFGRDFVVTPDVLIPRLETEWLVRRARNLIQSSNPPILQSTTAIDIGCGSGIIGTSIADLADEVIFLDVSPEALKVAEQNFRTHFPEKSAQFIVSDLLENLPSLLGEESGVRYVFLTNLPYIKDEDWQNMSADTIHEPKLALFGWEKTGFELYEKLFEQLDSLDIDIHCIYEFWFDQREVAEEVVKKYPQWEYSFFADYAGIERFGEIQHTNP